MARRNDNTTALSLEELQTSAPDSTTATETGTTDAENTGTPDTTSTSDGTAQNIGELVYSMDNVTVTDGDRTKGFANAYLLETAKAGFITIINGIPFFRVISTDNKSYRDIAIFKIAGASEIGLKRIVDQTDPRAIAAKRVRDLIKAGYSEADLIEFARSMKTEE